MVPPGIVDVWSVHLDWPGVHLHLLEAALCPEERQRAARFHFDRDRNRFVARRVALRAILGDYLGLPGAGLAFVQGDNGKPALAPGTHDPLDFNASHSAHLAVIAVACERRLGVDVEHVTPVVDFEDVARRFFAAGEIRALARVAADERLAAFFNCWTRKEAFVKALGEGLTHPLASFEVTLAPGEEARLLSWLESHRGPPWFLRAFAPEPGFVGAVAAPGTDWTIRHRRWQPDRTDRWLAGC